MLESSEALSHAEIARLTGLRFDGMPDSIPAFSGTARADGYVRSRGEPMHVLHTMDDPSHRAIAFHPPSRSVRLEQRSERGHRFVLFSKQLGDD